MNGRLRETSHTTFLNALRKADGDERSGRPYKGSVSNRAQKLIDTYFNEFKVLFGEKISSFNISNIQKPNYTQLTIHLDGTVTLGSVRFNSVMYNMSTDDITVTLAHVSSEHPSNRVISVESLVVNSEDARTLSNVIKKINPNSKYDVSERAFKINR